jgi:hypothetical protein
MKPIREMIIVAQLVEKFAVCVCVWNPQTFRVYRKLTLTHIVSQMDPLHTLISDFFMVHFVSII